MILLTSFLIMSMAYVSVLILVLCILRTVRALYTWESEEMTEKYLKVMIVLATVSVHLTTACLSLHHHSGVVLACIVHSRWRCLSVSFRLSVCVYR